MGDKFIEYAVSVGVALIVLALLAGIAWNILKGMIGA